MIQLKTPEKFVEDSTLRTANDTEIKVIGIVTFVLILVFQIYKINSRLKPATLLKVALLYGCFSRSLNYTNATKSRKASHLLSQVTR